MLSTVAATIMSQGLIRCVMVRRWSIALGVAVIGLVPRVATAAAGVGGFRLSEIVTASSVGDPAARYVELEATDDACVFPSTRVVSYDADGAVIGDASPFARARCVTAGTFLLLATPAAQVAFATTADGALVPPLPPLAAQVCLVSTVTRYDCVRWGAIATPIHDLFGPTDDTSAAAPPGAIALARVAATDVIAVDWRTETPSPRGPNDGTPWDPSDAGVDAPFADAGIDAIAIDAPRFDATFDATEVDGSQAFLDLDPGGGAGCSCDGGGAGRSGLGLAVAVGALLRRRRAGSRLR